MKRLKLTVRGRVQGVFFRDTAKRTAESLGIVGFARNEKDGSVYIEAEGDDEPLEKFLKWCRDGSPAAKVSSIEIDEGERKHFSDFRVLHE